MKSKLIILLVNRYHREKHKNIRNEKAFINDLSSAIYF